MHNKCIHVLTFILQNRLVSVQYRLYRICIMLQISLAGIHSPPLDQFSGNTYTTVRSVQRGYIHHRQISLAGIHSPPLDQFSGNTFTTVRSVQREYFHHRQISLAGILSPPLDQFSGNTYTTVRSVYKYYIDALYTENVRLPDNRLTFSSGVISTDDTINRRQNCRLLVEHVLICQPKIQQSTKRKKRAIQNDNW